MDKITLPAFQRLQRGFIAEVRQAPKVLNPLQKLPYPTGHKGRVKNSAEIAHYRDLVLAQHVDFFCQQFPVLSQRLGNVRCQGLVGEFVELACAPSPLRHEMGQAFLVFLQTQYSPQPDDPDYLLELAHYEWASGTVSIEEQEGPLNHEDALLDWQAVYQLSPVAWPVAYEWPVQEIKAVGEVVKPGWPTFIVLFRDDEDVVQQGVLTPILYELLLRFMDNTQSTQAVLTDLAHEIQQPLEDLQGFLEPILQQYIEQNILAVDVNSVE